MLSNESDLKVQMRRTGDLPPGPSALAALCTAALLLLGACAGNSAPVTAGGTNADEVTSGGTGSGQGALRTASDIEAGAQEQVRPPKRILPKNANRQGGDTKEGLPPLHLPWESEVPVRARVLPACAARGETVRLVIMTKPKAGVAFHAVYSDNRGGAEKPFGAGYGGNDKGKTGPDGKVVRSWVIGPTAPAGTGRIDIIVGWEQKWGYLGKPFAVADASGTCDAS